MPTVENRLPRLLSFKGSLTLRPGETKEMSKTALTALWKSDPVFRSFYVERGVELGDYTPPGKPVERAATIPRHLVPVHPAAPNLEVRKPEERPEAPPPRSTAPVAPTPVVGVPGIARQAMGTVFATTDLTKLELWSELETRKSVLEAIEQQTKELVSAALEEAKAASASESSLVTDPPNGATPPPVDEGASQTADTAAS